MRQTLRPLLIALLLFGGTLSNSSVAQQQGSTGTYSKALAFVVPKVDHRNMSPVQRVQGDPYCPGGSSACQGSCQTAAGTFSCSRGYLCCYPGGGQPGDCVSAPKCN
jgi:hypothetical protein